MTDTTRRGFLGGLLGLTVIAVLPKTGAISVARPLNPYDVAAPDGLTYQWVRTALLGIPDVENVQKRVDNGWQFVKPISHPEAPFSVLGDAIDCGGLVLMWRPTADVQAQVAREKEEALKAQAELIGNRIVDTGKGPLPTPFPIQDARDWRDTSWPAEYQNISAEDDKEWIERT